MHVVVIATFEFKSCTHLGGAPQFVVHHIMSVIVYLLCILVVLSSITKKGDIESASRPLIIFWMIDANTIKNGLMVYKRMCVGD